MTNNKNIKKIIIVICGLIAIILLLAVIYFGILSPKPMMPQRCELSEGLACKQFVVTKETITLTISNAVNGEAISIERVTVGDCDKVYSEKLRLEYGEEKTLILDGCDNTKYHKDNVFQDNIVIYYSEELSGRTFLKNIGTIQTRIR